MSSSGRSLSPSNLQDTETVLPGPTSSQMTPHLPPREGVFGRSTCCKVRIPISIGRATLILSVAVKEGPSSLTYLLQAY